MPESGNDSRDDLTVTMLTDQHMGAGSSVADWNHELLRMPERKDNMPPFPIQCVDCFMTTGRKAHRTCDTTNGRGAYRRKERTFHPTLA